MVKNLPANAGDAGDMDSIPGSEGSPCGGYGNSLQYFCLGNPLDRGTCWATLMEWQRVGHNLGTEHIPQTPSN